ncbi:3-hydroxy-3-methylglutaryl coenzyme A reductase, partial [Trifolium medium]|nr:3-hydroxy-3-methylglutaryl coenzyme A reductase [Trifolium medium]
GVSLIASVIYLMSFFGIGIIFQSSAVHYHEEEEDEADIAKNSGSCLAGVSPKLPPAPAVILSSDDEEIVRAV